MSKNFLLVGLFLFLFTGVPAVHGAVTKSKVVAVVNGAELSEAELNQEVNILMPMNQPFHGKISDEKMSKITSDALKILVDTELSAQDAVAKGMKMPASIAEEEIAKMVVKLKTKDNLVIAYKNAGFSEKSFNRVIERKYLAEMNRIAEVDNAVTVTAEKVKFYYTSNIAKYSKPEEYRASHILVKVDPSSNKEERDALKARAEKFLKRINNGENFADVASNESDDPSRVKGGDLGYFHSGQTVPEFEEAIIKLKVGEISSLVETLYGYHIIRLTEKRAPRLVPFDEIQEKLTKDLVDSEKKRLSEKWMERLYKNAKIVYPGVK